MLIRVIDIGSNSIKASLFRQAAGQPELLTKDKLEYALGDTVFSEGLVPENGIEKVADFMKRQPSHYQGEAITLQLAVATSAIRSAKNRNHVVQALSEKSGLTVRVLTGREESYLIHHGIASQVGAEKGIWIKTIDIGGGSAEIGVSHGTQYLYGQSFDLGAIRMARRFLDEKPLRLTQVQAMRQAIETQFASKPAPQDWPTDLAMGSSGNLKAIWKMVGVLRSEKGLTLLPQITTGILEDLLEAALDLTPSQIQSNFGLTQDRSRIIVPAIVVLQSAMQRLGIRRLEFTETGLRQGVAQFWSRHGHLQLPI
jgi:exopolyphosphatase / guanosine-5'-triphosphate,3'-diphosphate pyrophosphatase